MCAAFCIFLPPDAAEGAKLTSEFEIWIDGEKVATPEARVSVLDRGFLYGDSVFETLRTYGKNLFALDEHLARLQVSAERVFIPLPREVSALRAHLQQVVQSSRFAECYVRIMITRGQAALGLDPREAHQPLLLVIVAPLVAPPERDSTHGIAAVTFQAARLGDHTAATGAKIGNYLVAVLGQKKAAEAGAKEALISTEDGYIVEGATSNLFWLNGRTLYTVPAEAGILEGITRAYILRIAPHLDLETEMYVPKLEDLLSAEAVFISSSIREILSVVSIDGHPVGKGVVHPTITELYRRFRKAAEESARLGAPGKSA